MKIEDYFNDFPEVGSSQALSELSQEEEHNLREICFNTELTEYQDILDSSAISENTPNIIDQNWKEDSKNELILELENRPEFAKNEQLSSKMLTINRICDYIKDNVPVMYLANKVRFFNGYVWKVLTYERFGYLCTKYLPKDLLASMKTLVTMRDSFQYMGFEFVDYENAPINHPNVAVGNGVVNVLEQKILDFSPDYLVINQIKVDYREDANRPIIFERFLADMTPDTDMVWYMIADCLLLSPPHRIIWWIGPAFASGKSTLADFLIRFLGKENCSCVTTSEIGDKFGTSNLINSRFNIAIETQGYINTRTKVKLKELSGDVNISVEQKYQDSISIVNYSRLIFGSNDPITLDSPDDAFWDRIRIIPAIWSVPSDKRDLDLLEKIWDEREGILRKALEYAQKLINRNYIVPEGNESIKLKEDWKEQCADEMEFFIKKYVEIDETDPDLFTPTEELYEWFSRNSRQAMKKQTFSRKLTAYFAKKGLALRHSKGEYEGRQVRGFGNIRIRSYEAFDIEEEENE